MFVVNFEHFISWAGTTVSFRVCCNIHRRVDVVFISCKVKINYMTAVSVEYNVHISDVSMYHATLVNFAQLFHCTTKVEHIGRV